MKNSNDNQIMSDDFLGRYLTGEISDDEIKRLKNQTLSTGTQHEELSNIKKVLKYLEDLKQMKQVDASGALKLVKNRFGKNKEKNGWLYYWQKVAAVLIFPLIISFLFFYMNNQSKFRSTELSYNEICTPTGVRSTFNLPDGTKVWLNGGTKIKYPLAFVGKERRVNLTGEAYFEVAKNKEKPFIVNLGKLNVQAVGTAFNCMAYPGENFIETTLTEGIVKVTREGSGSNSKGYLLNQGQILTYDVKSNHFYQSRGDLEKHIAWKDGKFVFRNDPLEIVCQKLGRWFNADIQIKDKELNKNSFTGTFREQGLNEILDLISITSPISYTIGKRKLNNNEYEQLNVIIQNKHK